MTTKREQIFAALFALWQTNVVNVSAKRNETPPERLDAADSITLLLQQDGGDVPPAAEILLSPVSYVFEEMIELQIAAQGVVSDTTPEIDRVIAAIGAAIGANRTLGGLADDVRALEAPRIEDRAVTGAAALRLATVRVRLAWSAPDPLS